MATCPHCQEEYSPPSAKFCDRCGKPVGEVPADSATAPPDLVVPEERPVAAESSGLDVPAPLQPVATSEAPVGGRNILIGEGNIPAEGSRSGDTNVRNVLTGEGNIGTQTITNITTTEVKFCVVGNEELFGNRTLFRCPECNRQPVCDRHYNDSRAMCEGCIQSRESKATEMSQLLGEDEIVILGGEVVPRSTVRLVNGQLVAEDGRRAADLKSQTFYAKPKQWFRVKPKLLRLEQQAMQRLHPHMQVGWTEEGDCCWDGIVRVRSGNEYQIHLRYPHRFPFAPPKAYVVNPKIERSRHIYEDGHLCLFHKDDAAWETNTTAAVVMSWVSLWLHCHEVWKETGEWIRPEVDKIEISPKY